MRVKLLRRIQAEILKEPRRLNMSMWVDVETPSAPCGTAACIGGWAMILCRISNERVTAENFAGAARWVVERRAFNLQNRAAKALGLTFAQGDRLFLLHHWPPKFLFLPLRFGTRQFAQMAVDRIEHFIETKGEE